MSEGGCEAVRANDDIVPAAELRRPEERMLDLERLLGRTTMEVDILKEALELAGTTRRFPVMSSSSALSTALSTRVDQLMKRTVSCSNSTPDAGRHANMTARWRQCVPVSVGARATWSSPAGTARECASPLVPCFTPERARRTKA
jgi:hypothetical protein